MSGVTESENRELLSAKFSTELQEEELAEKENLFSSKIILQFSFSILDIEKKKMQSLQSQLLLYLDFSLVLNFKIINDCLLVLIVIFWISFSLLTCFSNS